MSPSSPAAALVEAALAQLAEGIVLADAAGRITYVNEAAARLHGEAPLAVTPEEYAAAYRLLTDDGQPYPWDALPLSRAVLHGETVTDARWRVRRPDGSEVLAVGSARPVLGPDGRRLGAVLTLRDDTARAAAERAERERNALAAELRDAFVQSPVSTIVYDAAGRPLAVNPAFERLWGVGLRDVPASYSVLDDPQLAAAGVLPGVRRAFGLGAGGEGAEAVALPPLRYDVATTVGRGETRWTQAHLYPVRDAGGAVVRVVLTHDDVTARLEAEAALEQRNAELQEQALELELSNQQLQEQTAELETQADELQRTAAALEERGREAEGARAATEAERAKLDRILTQLPAAVAVYEGPELRIRAMSAAYQRIIGGRTVLGLPVREALPDLGGQGFFELLEAVYATGETRGGSDVPGRWDDNGDGVAEAHVVDFTYAPLVGAGGRPDGVVALVMDVSERAELRAAEHAARAAAEESSARLAAVLDSLPDAAAVFDADWRYTYVNPAARTLHDAIHDVVRAAGGPAAEAGGPVVGRVAWEVFPWLVGTKFERESRRAVAEGATVEYVEHVAPLDRWYETRVVPTTAGAVVLNRDVTAPRAAQGERERLLAAERAARDEAHQARERLTQVFEQAPVAVAVTRGRVAEEMVFELANRQYLEIVPAVPAVLGQRVRDVFPDVGATVLGALQRVLDTGESFAATEFHVPIDRDRDGVAEDYYFNLVYHPLVEPDGTVSGLVTVATEVTAQVRARRDAERLQRAAEEANTAKSQFLANMSHELRTPLNAIQGHVQLLELGLHGPVTAPQREAFGRIDRAQRHLLGLINSILSYARLEGGRVEYDVREVRLADVVRDVLPMVEPQLLAKGLTLDVGLSDDAGGEPVRVWADQERLAQVLLNLLSNAVKFTAAGGRVAVTVGDRDDGSGPADVVFLRIADTGVGIPADKLEAVFEPFVQLRSSYVPGPSGTGLGLAISRDLARGMGGDLRARSVEGEGSTFTVTLRRVTTPAGEAADRRSGEERRADAERRVGDEPDASA